MCCSLGSLEENQRLLALGGRGSYGSANTRPGDLVAPFLVPRPAAQWGQRLLLLHYPAAVIEFVTGSQPFKYACLNLDSSCRRPRPFSLILGHIDMHIKKWKVDPQRGKAISTRPALSVLTPIKSMKAGTQWAVITSCKGSTKFYFPVAFTAIIVKANKCHCYLISSTITALW